MYADLLSLLQQQGTPTFPGGSPPPGLITMPEAPAPRRPRARGLLERMLPVPEVYDGLLSPQDASDARRAAISRFFGAMAENAGEASPTNPGMPWYTSLARATSAGRGAFEQDIGGRVAQGVSREALMNARQDRQSEQQQAQRTAQQQQEIMARRAAIVARYPQQPNETPQQTVQRLNRMLAEFIRANDIEMVKTTVEYLKSATNLLQGQKPQLPEFHNLPGAMGAVRINPDGSTQDLPYVAPPQGGEGPLSQVQILNEVVKIQDDFRADTRPLQLAAQGFSVIEAALKNPHNIAQPIQLLYALARVLDPDSVVREGEIATLQKLGSVNDRIRIWAQAAAKGTLPSDIIAAIGHMAKENIREKYDVFSDYRRRALVRGRQVGADLDATLPNPYAGFGLEPKPNAGHSRPGGAPYSGLSSGSAAAIRQYLQNR